MKFRWQRVRTVMRTSTIKFNPLMYEPEYTETPQYPPILDLSFHSRYMREKLAWHDKIKSYRTVEEKLMSVNLPRYYGWVPLILKEDEVPYGALPCTQHITRTYLRDFQDIPIYSNLEDECNKLLEKVKPLIEEALLFEYKYRSWKHEHKMDQLLPMPPGEKENIIATSVIQQINRILLGSLSNSTSHLLKCQVETDPRIESFWSVGRFSYQDKQIERRKKLEWLKPRADIPIDKWFQYIGTPALQLRHELPLPAVVELEESKTPDIHVPKFQYDPKVLGFHTERRLGTNIPGFWPGDPDEFGVLSYHRRGHLHKYVDQFGNQSRLEALHVQAILASYGWLHAQACYQGFSTFNELTYPLVTQTVITNGKLWSFYVYQLNTTLLHSDHTIDNPRYNLCWGTAELKLFEAIEDGKVIGLNDDVLKHLLKFYLNAPRVREGINLKPYLGETEKYIADVTEDERRDFMEKVFKYMYSNRKRHKLPYEIYNWENIYKIYHKTRPLEARRRPFELLNNKPYRRRYDDHLGEYICRDYTKKHLFGRQKYKPTYYPE